MEILSDISSQSSHELIVPLDFGEDQTTVTLEPLELPVNTHLFFDEDGNEISEEEHRLQQQEQEQEDEDEDEEEIGAMIRTPMIRQRFLLKHPRVILAFLRFVDLYNELADPEEVLMLPTIPQRIVESIREDPAVKFPPEEFLEETEELLWRLDRYADLSELHWD